VAFFLFPREVLIVKYLALKGWEKFQHYKDRDPPWVKLYRDLLTAESWVLGNDVSRLVQVASILLAARYTNKIPYRFDLIRKVSHLDCNQGEFEASVRHLIEFDFLEIQEDADDGASCYQDASKLLATCTSETEQRRAEGEQSREEKNHVERERSTAISAREGRLDGAFALTPDPSERVLRCAKEQDPERVRRIFDHWRAVHGHPRATLDAKRRRVILRALDHYSEADLCQSICGYKNSPHHMGQNDRDTVYDSIELMLRDAAHIDAGLRFYANPPRAHLARGTREMLDRTEDWVPPEMRHGNQ
jgi:hypothetical protein